MRRFFTAALTAGFVLSLFGASPQAAFAAAPTGVPTIVAPADGANVGATNPVLQWTAVTGAVKYRVQISVSNGFGTLAYNQDTQALHATPPTQLVYGTYFWRVAGLG